MSVNLLKNSTLVPVAGSSSYDAAIGNIAEPYGIAATYAVGDYCEYRGILYKCKIAVVDSSVEFDITKWEKTNFAEEIKNVGNDVGLSIVNGKVCITYDNGL